MKVSLKIIRQHLQGINKRLIWEFNRDKATGNFSAKGLVNIREILNEIETLGLFENLIKSFKESVIYTSSSDSISIQSSEGVVLEKNFALLKELVGNFLEVLMKTVPEENINSVNIKLPEIKDFDELSKVARDIHLGLTQVILNEEVKGQTKIVSVENGSIWINVFVGGTAISVVASLAWSAAVIYKKIQEGKLLEQQVRSLKVKNDSLEDILKAQKAETELMIQAEAEHIHSEHFKSNSPENIERIKSSISTFADLIGRGAEIQPSLIAPENVSNLFPDPTKIINIETKIKKLTSTSEN